MKKYAIDGAENVLNRYCSVGKIYCSSRFGAKKVQKIEKYTSYCVKKYNVQDCVTNILQVKKKPTVALIRAKKVQKIA